MQQLSRSIHLSLHIHKDPDAMAERAAHIIAEACDEAISERGEFKIAISGGKTPVPLFRLLSRKDWVNALPWDKISVFWADERCVSPDHPLSNYGVARRELLNYVPCTSFSVCAAIRTPWKPPFSTRNCCAKNFISREVKSRASI